ncbi:MAG TPA: cation:proton antiporter [Chloroflexota bacterium]|nr:cation:proton antiporter [Chloroflexota bacterium]
MFLVELAVILLAAKAAADLSSRLGQPPVLGQLVAGLALGSASVLLPVDPFGNGVGEQLDLLANLGVLVLMFVAGLETDWQQLKSVGRAAFTSASLGVLMPLVAGWAAGLAFHLSGTEAAFLGVILTATSVSISAQTLLELDCLQTIEGATILGAAVIDDVIGLVVFSIAAAASGAGGGQMPLPILGASLAAFFAVAPTIGSAVARRLIGLAHAMRGSEAPLAVAMAVALLYAALAAQVGIAAITGAYLAGLLINREDRYPELTDRVKILGNSFFVPIFLVKTGMDAHLEAVGPVFTLVMVISIIAIVSKILGCGFGARICGLTAYQSTVVGVGMISRGEVALITSSLALHARVISPLLFSATVLIVVVTTIVTPLLLRLVLMRSSAEPAMEWAPSGVQASD